MKLKILLSGIILFLAFATYSQQRFCADSSIRVKFIFGNTGAILFNNPDTAGKNIFTGEYFEGGIYSIPLLKTNWSDSIVWAKRLYINGKDIFNSNSFAAPAGTIICTGSWGGSIGSHNELLISRIDTNGNIQWAKRYKLSQGHDFYSPGNWETKNILVANNAIYFNARFNDYYSIIAKLDLDGNIIWSKSFAVDLPKNAGIIDAPVFNNNSVLFAASATNQSNPGPASKPYNTITKLSDTDGSISECNAYKTIIDTIGLSTFFIKHNNDNSFSLTGFLAISTPGSWGGSTNIINIQIDNNLNVASSYYYKTTVPLDEQDAYYDFNNQKQHVVLSSDVLQDTNKYLITFDKYDNILHSKKFIISNSFSSGYRTSVNLDDKQNLHFLFHYPQGNQLVTEYARISDFAPVSTVGCFGKDTSIITKYPFTLTKEPYVWDHVSTNVLTVNPVTFLEDIALVTKEVVCKQVSFCDSVHISGPDTVCINQPVRYTVFKNPECLKSLQWNIDTAVAMIVSTEGDTAITLKFKIAFNGYIHAAVYNCVVTDSFFVTVFMPQSVKIINKDSLLCPGKSIVLNATTGFPAYLWQNASTGPVITLNTPGLYKVSGTDYCGNKSSDSILIKNIDTSLIIPISQTICIQDSAYIILPNDVNSIIWQPTANSMLVNKTLLLYPLQTTTYNISVERMPACLITKSSTVIVKVCPEIVFIPNSFTPNNDGRNDFFRALVSKPLQFYNLTIFNRYGQKIFETTNPLTGWDGNFKNKPQPSDGYVYQCSYRFASGVQDRLYGYFILIR